MATSQPLLFASYTLTNADSVIFAMPTTGATVATVNFQIKLVNVNAAPQTVSINGAVTATATADGNSYLKNFTIAGYGYLDLDIPKMLTGYTLRGLASINNAIIVSHLGGYLTTAI